MSSTQGVLKRSRRTKAPSPPSTPPPQDVKEWMYNCPVTADTVPENCVICQEIITAEHAVRLTCDCVARFHPECIQSYLECTSKCPVCCYVLAPLTGSAPKSGTMIWKEKNGHLPGFPEGSGIIHIRYIIHSGTQEKEHPHPGKPFKGTVRVAYLPNTETGKHVLRLLKRAFDRRLIFTIGTSLTTGEEDAVCWAGIHHKTSVSGGLFGYPDETYLNRVQEELKQKGIN
jgi:deltex-like protein